jgi:hypothetical protein
VGDVGEGPAVHERRVVFQRLHQVRRQRVLQQHGHRAVHLQVARRDRPAVARLADHDAAQPLLQVRSDESPGTDGHHLGGHDDVEAVLARNPLSPARPVRPR